MNDTKPNSTCVKINDSFISDVLMGIYILAFVLGLILNLLTLGPIVRQVCRQNVLGVYLLNLSISDLLYIFTMPLWIHYYRMDHQWRLGKPACHAAGFFYYTNMYISIFLLCCISVDRCWAVTYPLKAKAFRRSRWAWAICLLVTIIVVAMHSMVLADEVDVQLDQEMRCYEKYPLTRNVAIFNLIRVGLGFVGPLLVLGCCYTQIFSKVRRSCGAKEPVKRKVKMLSIGIMVIFSVCFGPYHILLLTRSLASLSMDDKSNCDFEQKLHFYLSCALALSSINSVVDPVLYVLGSDVGQEETRICCRRGRRATIPKAATTSTNQKTQSCRDCWI